MTLRSAPQLRAGRRESDCPMPSPESGKHAISDIVKQFLIANSQKRAKHNPYRYEIDQPSDATTSRGPDAMDNGRAVGRARRAAARLDGIFQRLATNTGARSKV